jgi:hypothetical protein
MPPSGRSLPPSTFSAHSCSRFTHPTLLFPVSRCLPLECLLCDATNETSVRDMLCRDNKGVCRLCKQGNYSIEDTWRSQEEAEPGESPYSCQSLLDIIWSSSRTPSFPGQPLRHSIFPVSSLILQGRVSSGCALSWSHM